MREVCLSLLLVILGGSLSCWSGADASRTTVGDRSPIRSTLAIARGDRGELGLPWRLGLGDDKPSTDVTWSKGLTLGVNGPIPVIVVDQFGYPTKAAKVAVIRDPQIGYDNGAHFTPGTRYAVVDRSTGRIAKEGALTPWNAGATDTVSGDKEI